MKILRQKKHFFKLAFLAVLLTLSFLAGPQAKAIYISDEPFEYNIGSTEATIYWSTQNEITGAPEPADSTVYYTASSGPEWISQNSSLTGANFYSVDGINDTIWSVGYNGVIIKTSDGGDNWQAQSNPSSRTLFGLDVFDSNHIWAVGEYGTIIHYNGTDWSIKNSGLTNTLRGVSVINNSNVWAVGYQNTALYYNGTNWTNINTGINVSLRGVYAFDSTHVWAVGYSGKIYFYNGSTWSEQISGVDNDLYGIYAYDSTHVWAVGALGTILFYDGFNWSEINSGTTNDLYDVYVSGYDDIWICGKNGTVLNSKDGINWQTFNRALELDGIYATKNNQVWVVGINNVIQYYGLDYDSSLYNSADVSSHIMNLTNLSPATTYQYYVCSETPPDSVGETDEVCSNNYSFTTLGVCSDGTLAGECNASQEYCDPVGPTLQYDCRQCDYSCVNESPNLYCDTATGSCEPGCSEDVPIGGCLGSQYCVSANNLVNDCRQCDYSCVNESPNLYCDTATGSCEPGCDENVPVGGCLGDQYCVSADTLVNDCRQDCGYTCVSPTIYCEPATGSCEPGCAEDVPIGGCLGDQYCVSADTLVNDCRQDCGYTCTYPSPYCDEATGLCQALCLDGTSIGQCNLSGQSCQDQGGSLVLVNDCRCEGYDCPLSTPYCDEATGLCQAKCLDGTLLNQCNLSGQSCQDQSGNLVLINDCRCEGYDCPTESPYCDLSSGQCLNDRCADGTFPNTCNYSTGQYCQSDLTLVNNCNCGFVCPADESYCDSAGNCQAWCSDTTPRETCNPITHEYCDSYLNLLDDCGTMEDMCEYVCPENTPYCNRTTGECTEACEDGTLEGACSGDFYCNADLDLVLDCRQSCGYACSGDTPQCNQETGICEVDNIPPYILPNANFPEITIEPDMYSALVNFTTSEPTTTVIYISTQPTCSEEEYSGDVYVHYSGDLVANQQIQLFPLDPSTTYYLCIYIYDAAGNPGYSGYPTSEITFKTLAEPDTTPPQVSIIIPEEGQEVYATQEIRVEATDDIQISYVDVFIDEETEEIAHLLGPATDNIYTSSFDTTLWENGAHTLKALAVDSSGNETESELVNFTIYNDSDAPIITEINADVSVDGEMHMATITWTTNELATSRVDYTLENQDGSFDTSYGGDENCTGVTGHCVQSLDYVTSHTIILYNLEANRRYHYQITSCDVNGNCGH